MKMVINAVLRKAGYELHRSRDMRDALSFLFRRAQVENVVDIGANRGESVSQWREMFPSAHISCFEPVAENYRFLTDRFANDPAVTLYAKAVSNKNGQFEINLSAGHTTHSFLPRAKNPKYGPPRLELGRTEKVHTTTLDSWINEQNLARSINLLKIDTEGFESAVLEGATEALGAQKIDVVMVELMFVPIYEGQALYFEIAKSLNRLGYSIYDMPSIQRHADGQIRWTDGIFLSRQFRDTWL